MNPDNTDTIYFYGAQDATYGCFSNFSPHGFELDGKFWKTSEHYFQAMKFVGSPSDVEDVRRASSPKLAASVGRDRKRPLRKNWEQIKDDVMRRGVLAKFEAHPDIAAVLLDTGDRHIVENAPRDYYWGCGSSGTGLNKLGQILVETRALLRQRADK